MYYSTEINATQSPLLRLPAEIRNQIYSYIFSDSIYELDHEEWQYCDFIKFWVLRPPPYSNSLSIVKLPFACRQLHHETSLLPYRLATFDFGKMRYSNDGYNYHVMKVFLEARTKAQVENLGNMQVYVPGQRGHAINLNPRLRVGNGAFWAAELGCSEFVS